MCISVICILFNLLSNQTGPLRFFLIRNWSTLSQETFKFKDGLFISFLFCEVNMTFVNLRRGKCWKQPHSDQNTLQPHHPVHPLQLSPGVFFWKPIRHLSSSAQRNNTHRGTGRKVRGVTTGETKKDEEKRGERELNTEKGRQRASATQQGIRTSV